MNHHERLDSGEGEGEEEQFSNFKDRGCVSRSKKVYSLLQQPLYALFCMPYSNTTVCVIGGIPKN